MSRLLWLAAMMLASMMLIAGCGDDNDATTGTTNPAMTGEGSGADEATTTEDDAEADDSTTGSKADDEGGAKAGGNTIDIDVEPGTFKFEEDEVTVKAGTYTIRSKNPDAIGHNIAVEGNGVSEEGELVEDGGVSEITVELEKGTYEFYCTPHREAGMKGTLVVE